MGGVRGLKGVIRNANAPDECESKGCDLEPEFRVKFEEPEEWVYYCQHDAHRHLEHEKAVAMEEL